MALITQYGAANLIIDSGLVVTYSKAIVSGSWGYTAANVSCTYSYMWEIHRRARQSARYVGMTLEAANACRDAMIAKYTRDFKISIWDGSSLGGRWNDVSAGSIPMAEVAPSHNDDGSYDVVINVQEDDVRFRKVDDPISYAEMFATERQRTYEGGETEIPSNSQT